MRWNEKSNLGTSRCSETITCVALRAALKSSFTSSSKFCCISHYSNYSDAFNLAWKTCLIWTFGLFVALRISQITMTHSHGARCRVKTGVLLYFAWPTRVLFTRVSSWLETPYLFRIVGAFIALRCPELQLVQFKWITWRTWSIHRRFRGGPWFEGYNQHCSRYNLLFH